MCAGDRNARQPNVRHDGHDMGRILRRGTATGGRYPTVPGCSGEDKLISVDAARLLLRILDILQCTSADEDS